MKTKTNIMSTVLLAVAMSLGGGLADAQDEGNRGRRRGTEGRRPPQSETNQDNAKSNQKKEEPKPITAVVGGDVYTVTGSIIRGGTILIQDGKIIELGQTVKVPEGATTIDAKNKVITPGFVAINMSGLGVRSTPQNQDKLADALDPFDRNMKFALGVGITSGCIELSSRSGSFRRRRDGEPEQRFPGLDPDPGQFVTEALLDYGDENTSLCPCCGLPVLPTEPITAPALTTTAARVCGAQNEFWSPRFNAGRRKCILQSEPRFPFRCAQPAQLAARGFESQKGH